MSPAMERCDATLRQLDDLLDDELPPAAAVQVRHHLQTCEDCRAEHESRRVLRQRLRSLPLEPLPDGFAERLDRRLSLALPERPRRLWVAWMVPAATAVAGFVAAAAVAAPLLTASPAGAVHLGAVSGSGPVAAAAHGGPSSAATVARFASLHPAERSAITAEPAVAEVTPKAAAGGTGVYAVTVLTGAPQQARHTVADLVAAATAAGGSVRTVIGPGATKAAAGSPRSAATVDAVLPAADATAYVQSAGRYGTIMAKVGGVPSGSTSVRVLVTVLDAQRQPAAAVATPQASWGKAVLVSGGRAAPWVGGGLAGVLLVGLGLGLMRRRPL